MNMHARLLYVCLLFIPAAAVAQSEQKIYERYLSSTKNLREDTNKVLRYSEFAQQIAAFLPDTALVIVKKGETLARKLNYDNGIKLLSSQDSAIVKSIRYNHKVYTQFKREAASLRDDTIKVLRYLEFANLFTHLPDTASAITLKAMALSRKLNYRRGLELSAYFEGMYAEAEKDYPKAIFYFEDAVKTAQAYKLYDDVEPRRLPISIYNMLNSCLNIYYYLADYPRAMIIAQKGLALGEELNDREFKAHFTGQIGFIYQKQEKADQSIKYYTQYLNLSVEIKNKLMIADASIGIADGYLLKKEYQISLNYFFKALAIYNQMNDGGERFDRSKNIYKPDRLAYTLFKISTAYKKAGDYRQALHYSLLIFNMYHKTREIVSYEGFNKYDIADYYINTGDIYRALSDCKNADIFLSKGLSIAKTIGHREDVRDAYQFLAATFAQQKSYDSAYHYQQLYSMLKDSIINEKSSRDIEQIRSSFEVDKKNKEITLLKQRERLKESESENKTLLINIIVGFFTLFAIISYLILYIRNSRKQQKQANQQQLAVQAERQRISGDMHDDIGTGLSTMLIYVNMLKSKLSNKPEYAEMERIASIGNELLVQMKEIVWSLNAGNDSLENLLVFIRQYFVTLFEAMPYQTSMVFPSFIPDIAVKGVIRRNTFLCIKEALNNVIKHAGANWVELNISLLHYKVIIIVKDNGKGFPADSGNNFFSNGLKNMQRRMDQIKGKFIFFNDGGASVSIELELQGT